MFPVPSRYGVGVLSMGHLIEDGRAIAWRGPMVSGALSQLVDAHWGDTQVLVIDLPPGTGDVQLTMVQKHKPAGAVIVSTPQDLALMDASRAMNLFEGAQVPVLGLVENMAGYVCPIAAMCRTRSAAARWRMRRRGWTCLSWPCSAGHIDPSGFGCGRPARRR
jgi:ATP-binding protein involved in chromosome partitioning